MSGDRQFDDPVEPMVVERFRDREPTGRERALKYLAQSVRRFIEALAIALLMVPFQVIGFVNLDLPLALFDRLAPSEGLAASAWMSRGEGLLMLLVLLSILLARRWGGAVVGQAALLAWFLSAVFLTMLIIDLAPELTREDYPAGRFVGALLLSWVIGQWFAVHIYDLTRGGSWWRAPFFGAAIGFAVQAAIYFPSAFAGSDAPWLWWLAVNLFLTTLISAAFVLLYGPLRRLIRPVPGLGG